MTIKVVVFVLSLFLIALCMSAEAQQQKLSLEDLNIEVPTEVSSGETFKVVVTFGGEPVCAQLTFEGAVMDPVWTNSDGVAIVKAPDVTKPTDVAITVKFEYNQAIISTTKYYGTCITILPPREGQIKIEANSYWVNKFHLSLDQVLLISIKTDGHPINEYVLDQNSYSRYLNNSTITLGDYYQYNVIEGDYLFENSLHRNGDWYVILDNLHNTPVSVTVSINKYTRNEVKERTAEGTFQMLFEGQIMIAPNNYWSSKHYLEEGDVLLTSIKTDGHTTNVFILDGNSYRSYRQDRRIYSFDFYRSDVIEGNYSLKIPFSFSLGDWYVILENLHNTPVSATVSISKYTPRIRTI
ncbi:MAG: hypothetical protein SVE93_06135 [Candidatus Thermoplasmatota archaeon]|nr:hypothetical protein [Candidatus Thermoplasmatota archaeon]